MKIESLARSIVESIRVFSNDPGKGVIAFIKCKSKNEVRKLALLVASIHPFGPSPVYLVQGGLVGEEAWTFFSITKRRRIRLDGFAESGGTIFPEDRPIILLAEDFDRFDAMDQRAYCHLVDGVGYESAVRCSLYQGSVLLCGFTSDSGIESGSRSRGFRLELDDADE